MKMFPQHMRNLRAWLKGQWSSEKVGNRSRGALTHVIILDGTMSSLEQGMETNAGQCFRLLREAGPEVSVFYEAGLQFSKWENAPDVMMGRGINRQIKRAYGYLASRYRPGDRIFFFGYSRGAYAVRSLAGVIDRIGLLQSKYATERNIRQAYRHYRGVPDSLAAQDFAALYCHQHVDIEMIGVWDTVKALGLRLPVLWKLSAPNHNFHNHALGESVKYGFQALALDESRAVYTPVKWETEGMAMGRVEQVWFRGTHGDVGAQLNRFEAARPLANIPFIWMLERAQSCGLALPRDWQERYPTDISAPSVGLWRGWAKLFWLREKRLVGQDRSERIHESVLEYRATSRPFRWGFRRRA